MKGQKQLGSAVARQCWSHGLTSDGDGASVPGHVREDAATSPLQCNHPPAGGWAVDNRADPVLCSPSPHPLGCQHPLEASSGHPVEPSGTSGCPASENRAASCCGVGVKAVGSPGRMGLNHEAMGTFVLELLE